ncbi:MAG: ornithine--oxo-acid transaminase [Deltaproteobacteria bacterium]|nr:ornithine--oxo-acid transaminase [Deltaproteobacteria bacterium]MBN2670102.1 ornithine--oxo-acid transaminase [Deltaproteobacteria bacterium]
MPSTKEIIELTEKYGANNYHPLPVVFAKAEGVWAWDTDGNKYMDMLSAYSALNQGHRHPKIVQALKDQADRCTLTSRAFHNDKLGEMYKSLAEMTGMEMILPMNSGAEAVETAIKAVRKWGYTKKGIAKDQAEIIVCSGNFHGRTTTVVSFSSDEEYRTGFGPFTPGFKIIPYGDASALEAAITPNTCAFLVEPIQGEAGVVIPPAGYLKQCRDICDKNNVLLVADEIQTGFGRTGKTFCVEHEGVRPDVFCLGKALSGGMLPVSAVAATKEVLGVFNPGEHGSTFGGSPLACAVAVAALEVIVEEKLVERSAKLGAYFKQKLEEMNSPHVKEIRGKGLFIGVELTKEAGPARPFCEKLKEFGLLCKETHEMTIRFAPPLIISEEDLDWAIEQIRKVLA